jgi:hypothetical protein
VNICIYIKNMEFEYPIDDANGAASLTVELHQVGAGVACPLVRCRNKLSICAPCARVLEVNRASKGQLGKG